MTLMTNPKTLMKILNWKGEKAMIFPIIMMCVFGIGGTAALYFVKHSTKSKNEQPSATDIAGQTANEFINVNGQQVPSKGVRLVHKDTKKNARNYTKRLG